MMTIKREMFSQFKVNTDFKKQRTLGKVCIIDIEKNWMP